MFSVCGWELRTEDGVALLRVRYLWHPEDDARAAHATPSYGLTAQQCAELAGALQAQVLALKGQSLPPSNVTPIRH